ncbi:lycopene beta-cyclase CrtY [Pseudomonas sp. S07E 245]|uniref:lycopene beta-cyclase CrtY n=1 Tax=Pseudomonas sp. S07E 245 TaxID=2866278 RepID=UPI001C736834|nr:lycopene beta-cyclase CrtY [Pseudomonas sp. S07E 245]QYX53869.1 lycopene beta-cyclase CrtY [Pseudomonas sp. S07E 245]
MHYDLILAGGGLANGLIAWRLSQLRPELKLLCLERDANPGGNHTWSFHDADLTPTQQRWLEPLVVKRWPAYHVHFPHLSRRMASGYASITSERFAEVITQALGTALRTGCEITSLAPEQVTLASGEVLKARVTIDGRGAEASPHRVLGRQAFLGQVLRLEQPHGLQAPILMDARVAQGNGYRFVYVLPFSADTLLIEDTHYVDHSPPVTAQLRSNIDDYLRQHGWRVAECLREEQGDLPITLAEDFPAWWAQQHGQVSSGLRAGLCHCTTGYSLPEAVRLADWLATQRFDASAQLHQAMGAYLAQRWRGQGFYRLLNRMLFLAGSAQQRWQVMQRFYRLPEGLIARFYAGQSSAADRLRILSGKPPVPVGQALRAALRHSPQHFKEQS